MKHTIGLSIEKLGKRSKLLQGWWRVVRMTDPKVVLGQLEETRAETLRLLDPHGTTCRVAWKLSSGLVVSCILFVRIGLSPRAGPRGGVREVMHCAA